MTGEKLASLS